ncbi:MAG: DNA polymerase III subunit delta [Anaerolineae bacterium]
MLYILHGENELQRQEALAAVIDESGVTPDFRDLNTEVLEGSVSSGDLRRACSVVPFLGEARIVIAYDVLSGARKEAAQEIGDYLSQVPETTHLIFVEGKRLPKSHPAMGAAIRAKADVRQFELPDARDLPAWIRERTEKLGGQIEPRAAAMLAQNIGSNMRLLDEEIKKLLLYTGDRKTITAEDIRVMVPYVQSADVIFQMVDAVGQRNPRRAVIYLHRLLEVGEHPLGIFGMIVRQFRLMIQVRWLMDQRLTQQQIISRLKLHPFVARKIHGQASQFTPSQLRDAYQVLSETDLAIKRGLMDAETALDVLVAELTRL